MFFFCLGAAITVVLASQYGLPVSTTMCITGATVGVSLCNGDCKSFGDGFSSLLTSFLEADPSDSLQGELQIGQLSLGFSWDGS